jgi:hypothetical protein
LQVWGQPELHRHYLKKKKILLPCLVICQLDLDGKNKQEEFTSETLTFLEGSTVRTLAGLLNGAEALGCLLNLELHHQS